MGVAYVLRWRLEKKIELQKIDQPVVSENKHASTTESLQQSPQETVIQNSEIQVLENAFEKEIKTQKEEYSKIRSEEFWHFEEKTEEKKEIASPSPLTFEEYMGYTTKKEPEKIEDLIGKEQPQKNENFADGSNENQRIEEKTEGNPFESLSMEKKQDENIKREKILGQTGKPWLRKKN
jgi:hypothetical protein